MQKTAIAILILIIITNNVVAATAPPPTISATGMGIPVPNINAYLLNQDPDRAKAGDIVEVRLRVQNTGQAEARNVIIEALPDYPFTILTDSTPKQIIPLLPYYPIEQSAQTISFKFRIDRETTQGLYNLKFKYYLEGKTSTITKEFPIDVTSREFAQIFYIDKTKIMPGKETNITFTITNVGNAPLQDMVFSWTEPNGIILPTGTDNTRYIRYLEPGENAPLTYTVIASVNANPDLYTLDLNLVYKSKALNGSSETINTKAGIFLGGETDFDVSFSESTQGQTSISIANTGSNPAYSVTVSIPQQDGYRATGPSSIILGNLNKGDYTIASFQLSPLTNSTTPRSNAQRQRTTSPEGKLNISIHYTDTTGIRRTLPKQLQVQFRETNQQQFRQQNTSSISTYLILLILIIVILGVGYIFWRKKKRVR
jgi:hypothetical protein